jgi:hypothetical protein
VEVLDVNVVARASDDATSVRALLHARGADRGWLTSDSARDAEPGADPAAQALARDVVTVVHIPVLRPPTADANALAAANAAAQSAALRVVRICPGRQGYPLESWVLSPIPEICADAQLTVAVDFTPGRPDWGRIVRFARDHLHLSLLVLCVDGRDRHVVPAVLDHAPNVVVHVGDLEPSALRSWVKTFGAHRFVAGANAQGRIAVPAKLDDAARAALLEGTARELASGGWTAAWL